MSCYFCLMPISLSAQLQMRSFGWYLQWVHASDNVKSRQNVLFHNYVIMYRKRKVVPSLSVSVRPCSRARLVLSVMIRVQWTPASGTRLVLKMKWAWLSATHVQVWAYIFFYFNFLLMKCKLQIRKTLCINLNNIS